MNKSEMAIQNEIMLKSSKQGMKLFRNNVGVAKREDGIPVRYGLANSSKKINTVIKSSDLIGIKPIIITTDMIGKTIGQFVSIEVKKSKWEYKGTPREIAQKNWIDLINKLGGDAKFINNAEDL